MKKTLLLLGYVVAAVTVQAGNPTLTYWGGNDGKDLFTVDETWRYPENADRYLEYNFPYISDSSGNRRLLTEELTTLTTKDDTTYNLQFNTNGDVNFKLNESIYFNEVNIASGTMPNSITIDFGETGAITTASHFNIGQNVVDGVTKRPAMTLSADFSAEKLAELVAQMYAGSSVEVAFSRDILVANGDSGFWNVSETVLTFNDSESLNNLGFVNVGVVKSADLIQAGQYGLLFTDGTGKDSLTLVVKTPEPATATLSLLALAGLAARRRRH